MNDRERLHQLLIGYLLEILDPPDRAEVERLLALRPDLVAELERLKASLGPLSLDTDDFEPPADLAQRTADRVTATSPDLIPAELANPRGGWRWMDYLAVTAVTVAALMLLAPAMQVAKYRADLAGCQSNLQRIGMALGQYKHTHNGVFPLGQPGEPLAVAGGFAPLLVEHGYLNDARAFRCPGIGGQRDWRMPSRADLEAATPTQRVALQEQLSGDYGSTLGVWDGRTVRAVRDQGRSHFALVADTPSRHLAKLQSSNHCGRGQNVLFEALNVRFLPSPQPLDDTADSIYWNRCGYVGPGVALDDAVIGRSGTPIDNHPPCPVRD